MAKYLKPSTDQECNYMRTLHDACVATQDAASSFFVAHYGPEWNGSIARSDWHMLNRVAREVAELYRRMYGHEWSEYYTDRNPYRKVS